jgi:hypothetical protein
VFLLVMHHVPVARCADIIESLCGARPSDGFVPALLARAARGVAAADKLIRALVILARVVCAGETPVRVGPGPGTRTKYLLVACTNLLTYYFPGGRDLGTFRAFVPPDLSAAVVVHDRYQNYDAFPVAHQLCTAHYPDTVVMPISCGPVLAGGGARVRDIGIITGLRGRRAARGAGPGSRPALGAARS